MHWDTVAYALACVLVPMAWGLIVVWASNWIEAKVAKRPGSKDKRRPVRPIEYHI